MTRGTKTILENKRNQRITLNFETKGVEPIRLGFPGTHPTAVEGGHLPDKVVLTAAQAKAMKEEPRMAKLIEKGTLRMFSQAA